jgi:hypothetical protein
MKSCCSTLSKKSRKCKRKDGKIYDLPRRFEKSQCITRKIKGFSMRSSCAPYKYCKKTYKKRKQKRKKAKREKAKREKQL